MTRKDDRRIIEVALRLAAGMISTQRPYADKHPEVAYNDLIRMAKETIANDRKSDEKQSEISKAEYREEG